MTENLQHANFLRVVHLFVNYLTIVIKIWSDLHR